MVNEGVFEECNLLDRITTPSKALVITVTHEGNDDDGEEGGEGEDDHRFSFLTESTTMVDGTVPCTDSAHVVIASECFNSMGAEALSQLEIAASGILGLRSAWGQKHKGLRRLIAPHELRHQKEVTTILELGLWKAQIDQSDDLSQETREECRLNCGAGVIIPNVLSFL